MVKTRLVMGGVRLEVPFPFVEEFPNRRFAFARVIVGTRFDFLFVEMGWGVRNAMGRGGG